MPLSSLEERTFLLKILETYEPLSTNFRGDYSCTSSPRYADHSSMSASGQESHHLSSRPLLLRDQEKHIATGVFIVEAQSFRYSPNPPVPPLIHIIKINGQCIPKCVGRQGIEGNNRNRPETLSYQVNQSGDSKKKRRPK